MTTGTLLGLFAETPLHPGAGQAADVIDLPVAREGATGLPQIPDTGLKGALRQWAEDGRDFDDAAVKELFGDADTGAGHLMIASARLLCLPVRRLDGAYAWVTTPYLLERLNRDAKRCGHDLQVPIPAPQDGDPPGLILCDGTEQDTIYLEEFSFVTQTFDQSEQLAAGIGSFIGDETVRNRIVKQLAVMSDHEFAWYAANALPVNARNVLNNDTKMSENLWYEETVPPDALFYTLILPRKKAAMDSNAGFISKLTSTGYLRIGGNETVGQGWVAVKALGGGDDAT